MGRHTLTITGWPGCNKYSNLLMNTILMADCRNKKTEKLPTNSEKVTTHQYELGHARISVKNEKSADRQAKLAHVCEALTGTLRELNRSPVNSETQH